MKKALIVFGVGIFVIGGIYFWSNSSEEPVITNFEECAEAGNPVAESYPRQCSHEKQTFVEDIGNELEKADPIRLDSPRPNEVITNPMAITGEARGYWFFEASFPVVLVDWDGRIIAQHYAEAQSNPATGEVNWMTEEFVPFSATLEFISPFNEGDPEFMKRGALILQKDNPSGLPENDDALEIPIVFQ